MSDRVAPGGVVCEPRTMGAPLSFPQVRRFILGTSRDGMWKSSPSEGTSGPVLKDTQWLVSWGCRDKWPLTGWLRQHKFVLFRSWSLCPRCPWGPALHPQRLQGAPSCLFQVLGAPGVLGCDTPVSASVFTWSLCVSLCLFLEGHQSLHLGPTLT